MFCLPQLTELPMPNRYPSYDLDVDLSENPLQPPTDSFDLYKSILKKFHEVISWTNYHKSKGFFIFVYWFLK